MSNSIFLQNPEFRRNLWLSFSKHRLIAMPALLGLFFLAVVLRKPDEAASSLYQSAITLFIFIVWLWGARNANAAIVDELRDKTWDQQRMSALTPWTMTWGKLMGSTAFNWYGGLICLAVAVASGIAADIPNWLLDQLSLVVVGVMLHAALIALNLHSGQLEMRLIQRGGLGWLALIFVFISFPLINHLFSEFSISWWDMQFEVRPFLLGSALLFAACATFSAWRVMCGALQVRTLPWGWPLFACILAGYFAGLADRSDSALYTLCYVGLFVSSTMSYAALFTEPADLLVWHRLRLRQQARDWRGLLEHLPLWPTTLLLSFVFALLATLAQPKQAGDALDMLLFRQEPLGMALMLLRDACIVLFFSFSPRTRRVIGPSLLYLAVIDMLLPFLAHAAGWEMLSYVLLPVDKQHDPWDGVFVMSVHVLIAGALVRWRLTQLKTT